MPGKHLDFIITGKAPSVRSDGIYESFDENGGEGSGDLCGWNKAQVPSLAVSVTSTEPRGFVGPGSYV